MQRTAPVISDEVFDSSIFEGLSAEQVERVLPCIMPVQKRYAPGERVEEVDGAAGVVLSGSLELCGPGGAPVGSVGRGEVFDETAFCGRDPGGRWMVAQTAAEVLYLPGPFFLARCAKDCGNKETHQQIIRNMLRLLSGRTASLTRKLAYLTAEDLRTKLAMYLCELCDQTGSDTFTMPLNRDWLAAFFSVARPSLSREFAALRDRGVIEYRRSSVTVLDEPALRAIAAGKREG